MSRSRRARVATTVAGALAVSVAALFRRLRLAKGGGMQDIKEIARRTLEDPWRGKLDEVIDLVDDAYVAHTTGAPEPIRGKAGFREFVTMYLAAFPDGNITVEEQLAERDLVGTRWTGRGTQTGELMGMAPTGKEVTVPGLTISRIVDGKLREAWVSWDMLSLLQQLGYAPEPARAGTTS
jgi:steroid delta-isomerase-like uncharacterized protein